MNNNRTVVTKDVAGKKILVEREFNAPLEEVWNAYTDSALLDQWWAPKPWRAETKEMDFKEGGHWLYAMVGPNGEKHWARVDFTVINRHESFSTKDYFTDEEGNLDPGLPGMAWFNRFSRTTTGTKVENHLTFENETQLKKMIEMGFEEGYKSAIENLVELLGKYKKV